MNFKRVWTLLLVLVGLSVLQYLANGLSGVPAQGKEIRVEIEAGPFDLKRRYRSMEGPYCVQNLSFGELIAARKIVLPEGLVRSGDGASMTGGLNVVTDLTLSGDPGPRKLYWLKGIEEVVLDENGRVMPTAEFICHLNVDVDVAYRNRTFPLAEPCRNGRIFTITQGQTRIEFPRGYAVPVASDEVWGYTFQAANRTTDEHRRIRHRLTLTLVEDGPSSQPMKALAWETPFLSVIVDRFSKQAEEAEHAKMPDCLPISRGLTAPNSVPNTNWDDFCGRRRSGHFVVPPGRNTWRSTYPELTVNTERHVRLVWSHIHPLLEECSLILCRGRNKLFSVHSQTRTDRGLEIVNIDMITAPEGNGIVLPANEVYEIECTYNNTTGAAHDSMVTFGVFFDDKRFVRPDWVTNPRLAEPVLSPVSPVAGEPVTVDKSGNIIVGWPLFDPAKDGPLLKSKKRLQLETSRGSLRLEIDPSLAPQAATQMHRLLTSGAFDDTPFCAYQPGYFVQVAEAQTKTGQAVLASENRRLLRRLPVELPGLTRGKVVHRSGALTLSRDPSKPDSALGSFSILLGDAPHLDNQQTVFGYADSDPATTATLKALGQDFQANTLVLRSVKELK
ncbi:MAG: hypothetical protein AMXMBFR33_65130 [Candidatus Xenobia bacterium]